MNIDVETLLTQIDEKRIVRDCSLSDGEYNGVDFSHLRADKLAIER